MSSSLVEQLQGCMGCPEISSLEVGNHCQSTIAFHFDIFSYKNKQDPRLQGRAPGFRGEGYQVRDKTGIRQGQDRDK